MTYEEAYKFGTMIQSLFLESMDKLPNRVVIHKRTHFKKDEINGIKDSLRAAGIETVELLTIEFERERKELPYDINAYGISIHNYLESQRNTAGTVTLFFPFISRSAFSPLD